MTVECKWYGPYFKRCTAENGNIYLSSTLHCIYCKYAIYFRSDSGGSDSEDGSVSRRKKKTSRDKEKSKKSKKDKGKDEDKQTKGTLYIFSILYIKLVITRK